MSDRRVTSITGVIEFDDGQKVEIAIGDELDGRWGNVTEVLADAVEPCEVMRTALIDNGLLARDEQPEPAVVWPDREYEACTSAGEHLMRQRHRWQECPTNHDGD